MYHWCWYISPFLPAISLLATSMPMLKIYPTPLRNGNISDCPVCLCILLSTLFWMLCGVSFPMPSPQPLGGGFQDATSALSILVSRDASWCAFDLFSAVYTFLGVFEPHDLILPPFHPFLYFLWSFFPFPWIDMMGCRHLMAVDSVSLCLFSSFSPVMLFSSIFHINDEPTTSHVNLSQPMTSFNMLYLQAWGLTEGRTVTISTGFGSTVLIAFPHFSNRLMAFRMPSKAIVGSAMQHWC